MKRSVIAALACASILSVGATSSFAMPYASNFTSLFFRNAETFVNNDGSTAPTPVPGVTTPTITVGDTFYGVLKLNEIVNSPDMTGQTGGTIWPGGAPPEITGYFASDVIDTAPAGGVSSVYGIVNPNATQDLVIFGPAATDPNGVLAAGELLRVFEGAANYDDSTIASGVATATDGTLWGSLGVGASTQGNDPGGYWYSFAPLVAPVGVNVLLGNSAAGLNFVQLPAFTTFGPVNDPSEDFSLTLAALIGGFAGTGLPAGYGGIPIPNPGVNVDIYFNSEILQLFPPGSVPGRFELGSNDPAVFDANIVPEPGTLLLLGSGLLGLAGVGRRFRKGDEKN